LGYAVAAVPHWRFPAYPENADDTASRIRGDDRSSRKTSELASPELALDSSPIHRYVLG
jgi:hypothetical protein